MNIKKIAAAATAAVMAAGICTGVPMGTENNSPMAITAEATVGDPNWTSDIVLYSDNTADLTWENIKEADHYKIDITIYTKDEEEVSTDVIYVSTIVKKDYYDDYSGGVVKALSETKYTIDLSAMPKGGYAVIGITPQGSDWDSWVRGAYMNRNSIDTRKLTVNKRSSSSTKTTTTKTTKLAAPTNVKASASEEKVTLSWSKVSGAKAYRVYKYNSKTGKYVKYKDVTGTKCTVTGLKAGTKYKFKVYTLASKNGKYVQQKASKVVSCTTKKYNTDEITM